MTREEVIAKRRPMVVATVRALSAAMSDLRANRCRGLATARKYFPQVEEKILASAIDRLIRDRVIPMSPALTQDSWNEAVKARRRSAISKPAPYEENVDEGLIREATSR